MGDSVSRRSPDHPTTHHPSPEMNNLDIWPGACQTLGDETPVTALRGGFAAEQATDALRKQGPIEDVRDTSLIHQRLEARDIPFPIMVLAIVIANFIRWGQLRQMDVAGTVEACQKPGQVVLLGEP